jgi:phage-related protein
LRRFACDAEASLFAIAGAMLFLNGFVKKTQKTPPVDLALAVKRMKEIS